MTTTQTYTIFDADPSDSGDVAWPHASNLPMPEDMTPEQVLEMHAAEARESGEYRAGDVLWMLVFDDEGEATRFSAPVFADA